MLETIVIVFVWKITSLTILILKHSHDLQHVPAIIDQLRTHESAAGTVVVGPVKNSSNSVSNQAFALTDVVVGGWSSNCITLCKIRVTKERGEEFIFNTFLQSHQTVPKGRINTTIIVGVASESGQANEIRALRSTFNTRK